jgi:hypothetical protein
VSVGIDTAAHAREVHALIRTGELVAPAAAGAFRALSSFLKVFLEGLGLDKPYSGASLCWIPRVPYTPLPEDFFYLSPRRAFWIGGLSSYRLYVMIAHVFVVSKSSPKRGNGAPGPFADLGALLLEFLSYFR